MVEMASGLAIGLKINEENMSFKLGKKSCSRRLQAGVEVKVFLTIPFRERENK